MYKLNFRKDLEQTNHTGQMRDEEKDIDVNIKVGSMFRKCNKCLKLELELEHLSILRNRNGLLSIVNKY